MKRQVQTIKKLFAKCDEDNTNCYLALQELWATPINTNQQSPAELLFNRQLKTTLPAIIRPPHNSEAVTASLKARQDYSRYNAHSKEKPDLLPTQPIWVQDAISKRWNPSVVKAQAETPHSYIIQTPQGKYRRNCSHLKEAPIPTTVPEPVNTTYSTKVPLQPIQVTVYTKPLSPIKEPPSSNEGNSNIAAQCAPTLQSIPTVEKVKIKDPRRSSRISKLPECYIKVASINTNNWYNKLIDYFKLTRTHKYSDQFIVYDKDNTSICTG